MKVKRRRKLKWGYYKHYQPESANAGIIAAKLPSRRVKQKEMEKYIKFKLLKYLEFQTVHDRHFPFLQFHFWFSELVL